MIWYLVDPSSKLEHEEAVLALLEKAQRAPIFLLMNKVDIVQKRKDFAMAQSVEQLETNLVKSMIQKQLNYRESYRISGQTKLNLSKLLSDSWNLIPEGIPYYSDPEQVSDRPTRYFVAEKIRESLFYLLGEELPYSCAVEIESFQEASQPVRIEAVIYVERESQKGMVIGHQGKKIKEIGSTAREKIEIFLEQKVFLGLKVKLLERWSQTSEGLRKIGYTHSNWAPKNQKRNSG